MVRMMRPSELPNNYAAEGKRIRISDELIRTALAFDGWNPVFLEWPRWLWKDFERGIPCEDPEKNAYHIQQLARFIAEKREWIGRPAQVDCDPRHLRAGEQWRCVDGSHRIRAAQFLEANAQLIRVPVWGEFPPELQ